MINIKFLLQAAQLFVLRVVRPLKTQKKKKKKKEKRFGGHKRKLLCKHCGQPCGCMEIVQRNVKAAQEQ